MKCHINLQNPINHGIFTYYFIKGLTNKKADSTTDGVITLSELYYYVNERVINFTANNADPQHPQFLGNMDIEMLIVDRFFTNRLLTTTQNIHYIFTTSISVARQKIYHPITYQF